MQLGGFSKILLEALAVFLPMLLSLTIHEYAHAAIARLLGDRTAERQGRLSLNPLVHADPIGTIALPLTMLVLSGGIGTHLPFFGWAKPVPFDTRYMTKMLRPTTAAMLVAAAGPMANLLLAWLMACVLVVANQQWSLLAMIGERFFWINLGLCIFNLLPCIPLDGYLVLRGLLPGRLGLAYERWNEQYGNLVMMVLFVSLISFGARILHGPIVYLAKTLLMTASWLLG